MNEVGKFKGSKVGAGWGIYNEDSSEPQHYSTFVNETRVDHNNVSLDSIPYWRNYATDCDLEGPGNRGCGRN